MRYFFYLIFVAFIIGLIFGVFRFWSLGGFVPDLLLLLTLSLALAFKDSDYLFVAFVGGVWTDILYGLPIGSFTLIYLLAGAMSSWIFGKWLFAGSGVKWQHFILTVMIATLASLLWIWLYTNLLYSIDFSAVALSGTQTLRSGLMTLLANVVFAYPVYVIVELMASYTLKFKSNQIKL